jgi:hypothetical protein
VRYSSQPRARLIGSNRPGACPCSDQVDRALALRAAESRAREHYGGCRSIDGRTDICRHGPPVPGTQIYIDMPPSNLSRSYGK